MTKAPNTGPSRFSLIMLIVVFGLPPVAGWIYITHPEWLPTSQKNRGTLITPPRSVNELALQADNSQRFDWNSLSGHWTLVTYNQGTCDKPCEQRLNDIQQIRRAVGGERIRVERLLIQSELASPEKPPASEQQANGLKRAYMDSEQQPLFNKLFTVDGINPATATYLIDPNGMLMMGYPDGSHSKDILKDLELLLKASSNWTKGVNNGHG
ncbi:MAG: hypothetical protein OQL20_10425 [Sedimenticola sp.]|nr:hypothetical protein [Sedimenticola sp.]